MAKAGHWLLRFWSFACPSYPARSPPPAYSALPFSTLSFIIIGHGQFRLSGFPQVGRISGSFARARSPFRPEICACLRRVGRNTPARDRYRGGGFPAGNRKRSSGGRAASDSRSPLPGLRIVGDSLRGRAEVPADRALSVARMDSGRKILLYPAPGPGERRFLLRLRQSAKAHLGSADGAFHYLEWIRSLSLLRVLSGGRVSLD